MRTTITLDDDIALHLERTRHERGLTMKEAVNQLLRTALSLPVTSDAPLSAYRIEPAHTGAPRRDLSRVGELVALEDEEEWGDGWR